MPSSSSLTKPFAHYARYYDLLYGGKDYDSETQFVHARLRALGSVGDELLELGCGTGRHAISFTALGWNVTAVDISPTMIARAKRRLRTIRPPAARHPSFKVGDMTKIRLGKSYDAVVALFHVMGYQTSNRDLADSLQTAANHLRPGGLFFFDFWFGPAVLTDRPSTRVKRFEDQRIRIIRISEPTMELVHNVVSVDINVLVEEKRTHVMNQVQENHRVRYFFIPELESMLNSSGFKVEAFGRWMNIKGLDAQSWYGWIAARRR